MWVQISPQLEKEGVLASRVLISSGRAEGG